MKNAEYRFTLDLQKIQSQVTMQVNSGDTARTLLITLTNGGITHTLGEGSTAALSAKKSNGQYLFNSCSIVENNTVIKYDFTPATTDTPGIMQCEILITDPIENTIISPRFTMIVDALINGNEVVSESENTFMVKAMAQEAWRETYEAERRVNENHRDSNEATRISNEHTRVANELARQEAELKRVEAEGDRIALAEELRCTKLRIATLEAAATGNIYDTVEESDIKYTTQLPDVLPHGILSRVGGFTRWTGDNETSYGSDNVPFDPWSFPGNDGVVVVVSEASEVQITDYHDYTGDNGSYSIVSHCTIPTNQRVNLSEVTMLFEDTRDGSTWTEGYSGNWGASSYCNCSAPFKIIHGNIRFIPNPVKRVEIGLPYTLVGAKTYSGTPCTVKGNTVIMPKGSQTGVLIPCALPKGAKVTVTAKGENGLGEKVNKFLFRTSNGNASAELQKGIEGTLTADSAYLLIYKYNASTALKEELEINDIKIVISNPDSATLYDTHIIEIPDELITYLNDNGYDYGARLDETCYNYLDLTARIYHQYCKIENDVVVELTTPITVDVSEYLASDIDIVSLLPGCLVRFVTEDESAAPYTLSYKTKIGG